MSFRHYLEEEDDKPYYTKNSLAYYYEDMAVKEKIIKDLATHIAGYDETLKEKTDAIEHQVEQRLEKWDQNLEQFPDSVESLLTKWTTDGTIDTVIQTALIDEKLEPVTTQLAETALKLEGTVSVKEYGAIGDGVNDDTAAIRQAISAGTHIYLPAGVYLISGTLTINGGKTLYGAGPTKTTIKPATNDFDAVTIGNRAYRSNIFDLRIRCETPELGVSNTGIKFDLVNGAYECTFTNLIVQGFKNGMHVGDMWWMNTVENVRIIACGISFLGNGIGGTSINNLFSHVYSDRPTISAFDISSFKNTEFINCNFGGQKGFSNNATYAMIFRSNCIGMKVSGANFEHHIAGTNGFITVWSGSKVSFSDCNFFNTEGGGAGGYFIQGRDDSKIKVDSCNVIQAGVNMRGINLINNSALTLLNNDDLINDVVTSSSVKVARLQHPSIQTVFPPDAYGTLTVTGGNIINPNSGIYLDHIQLTVIKSDDTRSSVVANVSQNFSDGKFKIRFTKISDGTEDFGTHTVSYLGWKRR